ncbi:ankyrin [Salix suchowensis]|nr:ankyrin [Salix suchowensis]
MGRRPLLDFNYYYYFLLFTCNGSSAVAINTDENSILRDHMADSMIDSHLHWCVRQDNIELIQSRVQRSLAEKLVTPCGNTLLHLAASYGSDKVIAYLTEECPSLITRRNRQQDTVLHLAARDGMACLAIKSLITRRNSQNDTVLQLAASEKSALHTIKSLVESNRKLTTMANREVAEFLASEDPDVAYYNNNNGRSPLYLAVENGNKNGILDYLLNLRAPSQIKREEGDALPKGKSPVHAAIEQRDIGILKKIGEARPDLLRLTDEELGNSLHYASSIGFLEGVQFLLDKFHDGAYETNPEGNYPIHLACKSHSVDVVKEYLDIFPYPKEFLNKKGQNILHVAAESGKGNAISYIIKQDPKLVEQLLNEMDEDGNTPLHLAAGYGKSVAAFVLVRDKRVDSSVVNSENLTPYDLAEQQSKSAEEKFDKANEMDGQHHSKDVYGMKNSTTENSTASTSSQRKDKAFHLKRDTKKSSPKHEGLINYFGMVTTLSILYIYSRPKKSLSWHFTVTPGLIISQAKEESKNRIGNLLVVAVLVAGVTFAGAVQLPQLRDNNYSSEHHPESNSTITASRYSSYENHLYGYLFLDLGALSASTVAALILLWASFSDVRFILLAVQVSAFSVFLAIIMMFGAFILSVRIALPEPHEVWLRIAITVVAVVFFLVQAFLFLPWILPRSVNHFLQRIILHHFYCLWFFTLFYCWRWLTEILPELPVLKKNDAGVSQEQKSKS